MSRESILDLMHQKLLIWTDDDSPMTLFIKLQNGDFGGTGTIYFSDISLLNTMKDIEKCKKGTLIKFTINDTDSEEYYFELNKENDEIIIRGKIGDYTDQSLEFYFSSFELSFYEVVNKISKIITEIKDKSNL